MANRKPVVVGSTAGVLLEELPATDALSGPFVAPGSSGEVLVNNAGVVGAATALVYSAILSGSLNVTELTTLSPAATEGGSLKLTGKNSFLGGVSLGSLNAGVWTYALWDGTTFTIGGNTAYHAGNQLALGTTASAGRSALGLGTAATVDTGTSGARIPLLSTANTFAETQAVTKGITLGASASSGNVYSGTYTPTLTNLSNLDASTAFVAMYTRVGDVVTVTGKLEADPTAATTCTMRISLPIASDLASAEDLLGTGVFDSASSAGYPSMSIYADAGNDVAYCKWRANDTANRAGMFTFTYLVK